MAPRDKLTLVLLLAATLLHILAYFNRFSVPSTDFFAFRRDALAYMRFEGPENYKRGPVFPLLMGGLAKVIGGQEPELLAVELLNLALSLVLVYLSLKIATAMFGRVGLAVAFGVAMSPLLMPSGTQPLAEATLAVGIALTAYLALCGSPWAYLAAALASMTRYEAALLLLLLVLKDVFERKKVELALARGLVAGLPLAIWLILGWLHGRDLNPYVSEMGKLPPSGLASLVSCTEVSFKFFAPFLRRFGGLSGGTFPWAVRLGVSLLVAAVAFGGLIWLWRQGQRMGLFLALFLGGYLIIHLFWWAVGERYTYVVLWIVLLGVVAFARGTVGRWRCEGVWGKMRRPWVWVAVVSMLAVGTLGVAVIVLRLGVFFGLVATLFIAAALLALSLSRRAVTVGRVACGLAAIGACVGGVLQTAQDMAPLRDYRAPYRLAGEWLRSNAAADARVVSLLSLAIAYYSHLPEAQVREYFTFPARDCDQLLPLVRADGIDYVLWDSQAAAARQEYGRVLHRVDLMHCLFSEDGEPKVEGLSLAAVVSVNRKRIKIYRLEQSAQST